MKFESKCLHSGYTPGNGEPQATPIYQSTTFRYQSTEHVAKLFDLTENGFFYSRLANPTVDMVEKKIADLYKEKFGINLEEYAVKAPEPSSKRLNFLLDNSRNAQENQQAPMQQQAPAGMQRMQGGGNPFGGQPATMGGMSPARGGAPSF